LPSRYGVNRKTIAKWKAREFTSDERMGPKNPCSSVLTLKDEAIILAYRWRTHLSLNDCHDRLRAGFVNARTRQTGRLFQGRFGSVAMDEDHLMAAAHTVALNPAPAGLSGAPGIGPIPSKWKE
jgi:hypothetical protein